MRQLTLFLLATAACAAPPAFRMQEIGSKLGVVYAVNTADVNADGRLDIVAISATEVMWFENPGWTKHVVATKVTERDNVALATYDINGDGRLDFALGADWQSTNTASGGSLHWLTRQGEAHKIATEPTLHRIGWARTGQGKAKLIVVPLHGRGTKAPDWTDGEGARVMAFSIPANPAVDDWPYEVISDKLHIVHNFIVVEGEVWTASAEGVSAFRRGKDGKWTGRQIGEGRPGEIKMGQVKAGKSGKKRHLATVEPWHGNSIVIYEEGKGLWPRKTIASDLNQAHALGWADFNGDGSDELTVGWRGKPWGIALFAQADGEWKRTMIDEGMATEDLAVGDLNGDGRPEIIAGGRATENIRIYWNQ